MKNMKAVFISLIYEESGQDLIEYALIAALIALGAVTAMGTLGNTIGTAFNKVSSELTNAI